MLTAPGQTIRSRREVALLCLLAFGLLIGFSDKPFHIDDPLFVWTAERLRLHPLDFYGFHLNWQHQDQPVSQFFENPPLTSYWIAVLSFIHGTSRLVFHLGFLPFNVLSVVGMYQLARHFCARPFLASLLLLLSPAFLTSATTVMCEPLLFCFWIWAIYFWILGAERSPRFFFFAGLLMLLAALTKFLALALIPLAILFSICRKTAKRSIPIQAVSLLLPVIGVVGYEIYCRRMYGVGGISGAAQFVNGSHEVVGAALLAKLSNTFAFLGGCAASAVAILPLILPRRVTIAIVSAVGIFSVYAFGVINPLEIWRHYISHARTTFHPGFMLFAQTVFWTAAGITIAVSATRRLSSSKGRPLGENLFLFAWIAGIFIFTAFINWSINARTLLPLLPPVCIFIVRELDRLPVFPRTPTVIALVVAGTLAIAVAAADYKVARTLEIAADEVSRDARAELVKSGNPTGRVWFAGHWGFQYYIEKTGALPVDVKARAWKPGDVVIFSIAPYGGDLRKIGLQIVRTVKVGPPRWLATTQAAMGANFYCSYGEGVPFLFDEIPPEEYEIYRLNDQSQIFR